MVTLNNLVFRADGRALIDRASLAFEPGKLHLIVGSNGAGKSTLIRLLARLLRPAEGNVYYDGRDVATWTERELARSRAVLSQVLEVAFAVSVQELVLMGRYPHFGVRPSAIDLAICDEVMRFFDVDGMAGRNFATLSGGERQRVQFARVFAQVWRPLQTANRYLFLDEPLTFLDIRHQLDFMQKIRSFSSQKDVVVIGVVHDIDLATQFADRLLLLDHGRCVAFGSPAQVLTEDNLHSAFAVSPVLLTNPATGKTHLVFESD